MKRSRYLCRAITSKTLIPPSSHSLFPALHVNHMYFPIFYTKFYSQNETIQNSENFQNCELSQLSLILPLLYPTPANFRRDSQTPAGGRTDGGWERKKNRRGKIGCFGLKIRRERKKKSEAETDLAPINTRKAPIPMRSRREMCGAGRRQSGR